MEFALECPSECAHDARGVASSSVGIWYELDVHDDGVHVDDEVDEEVLRMRSMERTEGGHSERNGEQLEMAVAEETELEACACACAPEAEPEEHTAAVLVTPLSGVSRRQLRNQSVLGLMPRLWPPSAGLELDLEHEVELELDLEQELELEKCLELEKGLERDVAISQKCAVSPFHPFRFENISNAAPDVYVCGRSV